MYTMTDAQVFTNTILPKLAELGSTICQIRKEAGMSQEVFASMLGVGPKRISEVEDGRSLDVELISKCCETLSINLRLEFEVN